MLKGDANVAFMIVGVDSTPWHSMVHYELLQRPSIGAWDSLSGDIAGASISSANHRSFPNSTSPRS